MCMRIGEPAYEATTLTKPTIVPREPDSDQGKAIKHA